MSCSSYGYVVIGIHLSGKEISRKLDDIRESKKITVKGCGHEFSIKAKFCPECGKPSTMTTYPPEVGIEEFLRGLGLFYKACTDGTDYFITTDKKYIAKTDDINACGGWENIDIPSEKDFQIIRETLRDKLFPYGLLDVADFASKVKIWVVGYCSY